jgi:hypothetical protein
MKAYVYSNEPIEKTRGGFYSLFFSIADLIVSAQSSRERLYVYSTDINPGDILMMNYYAYSEQDHEITYVGILEPNTSFKAHLDQFNDQFTSPKLNKLDMILED